MTPERKAQLREWARGSGVDVGVTIDELLDALDHAQSLLAISIQHATEARRDLLAEQRANVRVRRDYEEALQALAHVQARCTELVEANRELRRRFGE